MTNDKLIEPTLIEGHELSDCPHCGETPTVTLHPGHAHTGALAGFMQEVGDSYTVECCGGMIEGSLQELSERWNKRAAPDHWVPVSERLPEPGQYPALVAHKTGAVRLAFGIDKFIDDEYMAYYEPSLQGRFLKGVTHWMPLPAAPEVGQ